MPKKLKHSEVKTLLRNAFANELIGEGSGRIVRAFRNSLVIKIAKNKNGIEQNKNEIIRYKKYGDEKPLAKIFAYSKKVIIMEKVEVLPYNEYEYSNDDITRFLDEIVGCCSTDHLAKGKTKDGRIVAYDYGDSAKIYKQSSKDYFIMEHLIIRSKQ